MINFFVVGSMLPWIANYLTYGNMICFFGLSSLGEDSCAGIRGVADNNLLAQQDSFLEKFPEAKWIICNGADIPYYLSTKMEEIRLKIEPIELHTGEGFPTDLLAVISDSINPNWSSPYFRHKMLSEMAVTAAAPVIEGDKAEPLTSSPLHLECLSLVKAMCGDNQLAWVWLNQAFSVALTWDHLVDGDAMDYGQADFAFKSMLLEWPNNSFFINNARSLTPVMASAISSWQASYLDGMPKDGAYAINGDLSAAVAFLIGGQHLVDKYIPRLRRLIRAIVLEDMKKDLGKK